MTRAVTRAFTRTLHRREFIAGLGAGLIAAPAILRAEGPVVIRAGALKLIHSIAPYFYDQFVPAGYKMEVLQRRRPNARTRWSPSRSISAPSASPPPSSAPRPASRSS